MLSAVKAIKTYIRTKSGRLVERIVFLSEEDYNKFMEGGGDAAEVLKKYLSKDEADNLDSWDKEEVRHYSISHCLSVVGLRPFSSLSTSCVVSLRGD